MNSFSFPIVKKVIRRSRNHTWLSRKIKLLPVSLALSSLQRNYTPFEKKVLVFSFRCKGLLNVAFQLLRSICECECVCNERSVCCALHVLYNKMRNVRWEWITLSDRKLKNYDRYFPLFHYFVVFQTLMMSSFNRF